MGGGTCKECGASLDSGAPDAVCPVCMLGAGLDCDEPDEFGEVDFIAERPGDLVGRYRLVEKIGEGGFGVVFRAEQEKPVRRVVALKVIKPGMDSREVVTRFEVERQALALMDHPNIAKIHDAGTTERGRPYFVMEFVEGLPVTEYCDAQGLGIPQRLLLFAHICQAVQHAHQKGVIHRDLKPSNILVHADEDGAPAAKIIDFGVAKAISIELTEKTFFTMFGRMLGTPQYMSPEQAELNAVDVDTRSDIYSLGVVLYELVTGCAPLSMEELSAVGFDDMRRMIREVEPLKPSACVMNLRDEKRREIAAARCIDAARFRRYVAGDLDWVVMKALDKDRNRRYSTAHGLALDIRRFLKNLPVVAGPPGAGYRIRKFVRRNQAGVGAGVLVLLALIGGYFWNVHQRRELQEEKTRTGIEWNRKEYERLKLLVEGVKNRRAEVPGTREAALEDLREVGFYPLDSIGLDEDAQRRLRDAARNELIACLAWTDLQAKPLLGPIEELFVRAALDSPQERCVLVYPGDGRVEVRDVQSGASVGSRPGSAGPIEGPLRFSPDGDLVALGTGSGANWGLVIWNWREGKDVVTDIEGIEAAFDFHPGGKAFAVGTPGGEVRMFDRDGAQRGRAITLQGEPLSLRFSTDGRHLAVGIEAPGAEQSAPAVAVIELATGAIEGQWSGPRATSLAWDDGGSIVVGGADGSVTVLNRGPLRQAFRVDGHSDAVDEVAWSSDGLLIASGSGRERIVRLWDGRQGKLLCEYTAWARTLGFAAGGKSLGPVLLDAHTLSVLEVQPVEVCHSGRGHSGNIHAADWSTTDGLTEGGVFATAAADGLRLWNREGLELARDDEVEVSAGGLDWSADHLYVASPDRIWRVPISIHEGRLACGEAREVCPISGAQQIKLSPDGATLAVARDGEVLLVDPVDGRVRRRLEALPSTSFLDLSPDGVWLAAGTRHGESVRVWRLPAEEGAVTDLPVGGGATVAFYPKTHFGPKRLPPFLMTGGSEAYHLWTWSPDARTWAEACEPHRSEMANPRGRMAKMVFSPRGTAVVVLFDRKYLQILNPTTMELMTQPRFDEQWPLAVSGDGRMMATESADGLVIWNLEEVRRKVASCNLDWRSLPGFPPESFPIVKRPLERVDLDAALE